MERSVCLEKDERSFFYEKILFSINLFLEMTLVVIGNL